MIELRRVDRSEIAQFWPVLEPMFARIPGKVTTEVTPADILERSKEQTLLLWVVHDDGTILGTFASGIRTCGTETVAFVEAIAGDDLDRWLLPALADFEARAKNAGATIIEHEGRSGWARKLPGYRPVRIVLQKVL